MPAVEMPTVEMRNIDKQFGQVRALSQVDLKVEPGAIHALIGENGAGKTTLMRILYGATQASGGEIYLNNKRVKFANSAQAINHGIGMVSQHYAVIPDLTNLQNLMLGAEPGWLIQGKAAAERAQELAEKMGFQFNWNALSSELSPAGAQKLEILKLLWRDAKIMILDEPTAMLSPADSDALFVSLKQLADAGATVILVTHRLLEVVSHCKHVTVLRGGKLVADQAVGESSTAHLAELIVGHAPPTPPQLTAQKDAPVQLKLSNLTAKGYRGDLALNNLDLEVKAGEILGIAGVDGNGQRELFQVLTGELKPEQGEVAWQNQPITHSTIAERLKTGFRQIPEDRHEEGVIDGWSLEENAALGSQREAPFAIDNRKTLTGRPDQANRPDQYPFPPWEGSVSPRTGRKTLSLSKGGEGKGENPEGPYSRKGGLLPLRIDTVGRRTAAEEIAARLNTKHGGIQQPMSSLSGGNQQRFVAGRVLFMNPKLILAFQPARGLDIEATSNLYGQVRELCKNGACAVVVSFDLDEILENCDRVAVMHAGHIALPEKGKEHDRQAIGMLMVGAS